MSLPPDPDDNRFSSWQYFFRALDAQLTGEIYDEEIQKVASGAPGHWQTLNFHAAAIDRLFEHGGLNPDLNDDQRQACLRFAERGIELVEAIWASDPETIARFRKAIAASKEINELLGNPTAR
jgi:hypothetical protein